MIERHTGYRPIEGATVGIVEDIIEDKVLWRVKSTIFEIPIERFEEFFCRAEGGSRDRAS